MTNVSTNPTTSIHKAYNLDHIVYSQSIEQHNKKQQLTTPFSKQVYLKVYIGKLLISHPICNYTRQY